MEKVIEANSMRGVRYEIHKVERILTYPLYYAILKFNNGDIVETEKARYKSECMDFIRTVLAEESVYG